MKAHIYDYVLAKYNHFLVVRYMFNIYDSDLITRWFLERAKSVSLLAISVIFTAKMKTHLCDYVLDK